MATLKGQNFRICAYDSTDENYKVIGMATSCTITLNGNTENASTKDDVGAAQKPTIVSKSWQVQVESLNVADTGAMLTAAKAMAPLLIMWDQVSTTDNQTHSKATYARKGMAYLSDATFNFNDRENSAKSLQFTGASPLEDVGTSEATEVIPLGSYTKGQFVRLFIASTASPALVVAGAKQLSLHVSLTLADATTKDTDDDWQVQEPVELSYDISSNALVDSGDTITSAVNGQTLSTLMANYENEDLMYWQIANVSGDNNRTKGAIIVSGQAYITQLTVNAPNRQTATYDTRLSGYGAYTVAA